MTHDRVLHAAVLLALAAGVAAAQEPAETIGDLAVVSAGASSVTLTWSAPLDPYVGSGPEVNRYDVRVSTAMLTEDNFDAATALSTSLFPTYNTKGGTAPPGIAQTGTVPGLTPGVRYYFAVKSITHWNVYSAMSNVVTERPRADSTAPAAISTLAVTSTTDDGATLAWTATGDDGGVGTAQAYDLRFSTRGPLLLDSEFDAATQVMGVPLPLLSGTSQGITITGLPTGREYHFALRVVDEDQNWSGLSNSPSGTVGTLPVEEGGGGGGEKGGLCGAGGLAGSILAILAVMAASGGRGWPAPK